ncbi:MAG TPA: zf-HC2 domain-containing protein [Burkholderiales bacterium]
MKIDCKEASRLISRASDGDLSFGERVRLRLHLAICDACSNFNRQVKLLRKGVRAIFQKQL